MLTLALALLLAGASPVDHHAGNVSALLPAARIERAGAVIDAQPGSEVQENDLFRTDAQGRARIRLIDQSILSLGVNSQLRIVKYDKAGRQASVQLNFGKLRARVAKLTRGGRFEVSTPVAVAGAIGTDFGVDASDPDLTKVICISGMVQITSADPTLPGTVTCRGGTTVTVRRGQPPEQPQAATRDQIQTWKTNTEPEVNDSKPY